MRKIAVLVVTFLILAFPTLALAHNKDDQGGNSFNFSLKTHQEENGDDDEDSGKFEIRGEIESVSGNSFVIGGQTILIDLSEVEKFKQKGLLDAGNNAKVEGIIANDQKIATKINVIGTGQGRFKFEVRGLFDSDDDDASPTPSPSPSPEVTLDEDASPSPDVSPSPEATSSANVNVKIKAKGPISEVIEFLTQVLSFLQNIT